MPATLLQRERISLDERRFVELLIWSLPAAMAGSEHCFKYRLALVIDEVCVLRYDNEAGKGDHKHLGALEAPYRFQGIDQLIEDFWTDVSQWAA
ncbi:toxin-antitoxin system TumE family protein [Thiorhodovibrio frisius]|uniref:Uncharacterized protein n=1 Tax=Thiorhodovibrio frisius TaxID=631362 RepID=H8Z8D1_9GAMM|nr:DUF6516 family protein [Thiorhodovibrio frisius]EIC19336.1 hypothetical protein Thi970DRAFT_04853 [Thiorhodovibrio frisius]WPL22365.1 hypothetical protein Thiofri_02525 [Thiorhodovibrio frisius]